MPGTLIGTVDGPFSGRVEVATSLKDVALRAGVSIKTVSNVVNDYPYISDATRTKVQAALDDLGYRPNLAARNLRQGRTGVIALAVPELESAYFAELARATIKAAEKRRWTVLIDQTDGVRSRELEALRGLRNQLDGLIISPLAVDSQDLEEAGDMPVVVLGERVAGGTRDHVAVDNVGSTVEAVSHLVVLGRTRIAAIGAQSAETASTAHLRLAAYQQALEMHGLDAPRQLVRHAAAWHRAEGAVAMAALLDLRNPPDAVFCFNDLLALGAMRVLHQRGVKIPEEIAVVGYDDIEDGRFSTPTLTTVSPDKVDIARTAVRLLSERLADGAHLAARGKVVEPKEITAPSQLVVRESTVGPGAATAD